MATNVDASGCGCPDEKVKQSIENAYTVFIGEVVEAHAQTIAEYTYYKPPGSRSWISEEAISPELKNISESKVFLDRVIWARFVNVRLLKGSFDTSREIRMGDATCSMNVGIGGLYLVISEDGQTTGICEGAKELTQEDVDSIKTLDDLLKTYNGAKEIQRK